MSATRIAHSFELYPPRTPRSAASLPDTIRALAATAPDFFSVTYGASGSTTDASFDLVRTVAEQTGVDVMAHLTCAGSSPAEVAAIVRRFLDAGAHRFLAVRGDAVAGGAPGGLRSAAGSSCS